MGRRAVWLETSDKSHNEVRSWAQGPDSEENAVFTVVSGFTLWKEMLALALAEHPSGRCERMH